MKKNMIRKILMVGFLLALIFPSCKLGVESGNPYGVITKDGMTFTYSEIEKGYVLSNINLDENVNEIVVPKNVGANNTPVVGLGYKAFSKHKNLEEVHLPSTVSKIDSFVFFGCNNLSKVHYESSVYDWVDITKVALAFESCGAFDVVCLDGRYTKEECMADADYSLRFEYNASSKAYTLSYFSGSIKEFEIPEMYDDGVHGDLQVTEIAGQTFMDNTYLKEITIPSSIKEIGDRAFKNCSALETINLSKDASFTIGESAFENCQKLRNNTTFEKIILSLQEIPLKAFYNCSSMAFSKDSYHMIKGTLFNAKYIHSNAFVGTKIETVILPNLIYLDEAFDSDVVIYAYADVVVNTVLDGSINKNQDLRFIMDIRTDKVDHSTPYKKIRTMDKKISQLFLGKVNKGSQNLAKFMYKYQSPKYKNSEELISAEWIRHKYDTTTYPLTITICKYRADDEETWVKQIKGEEDWVFGKHIIFDYRTNTSTVVNSHNWYWEENCKPNNWRSIGDFDMTFEEMFDKRGYMMKTYISREYKGGRYF